MIFATVGTQLPFPRFLAALDAIAGRHGLRVLAQTCQPDLRLTNIETHASLEPTEFDRYMSNATLIVGHAGIGTILGARRAGMPLILYPRRASLGEHRNEHQLATVAALGNHHGIRVALDDATLEAQLIAPPGEPMRLGDDSPSRNLLTDRLRRFIED